MDVKLTSNEIEILYTAVAIRMNEEMESNKAWNEKNPDDPADDSIWQNIWNKIVVFQGTGRGVRISLL